MCTNPPNVAKNVKSIKLSVSTAIKVTATVTAYIRSSTKSGALITSEMRAATLYVTEETAKKDAKSKKARKIEENTADIEKCA